MKKSLSSLEKHLNIRFNDKELLKTALTHPSFSEDALSYQRLEFLGDAVLDLIIREYLYENMPDSSEGKMTSVKKSFTNEKALARFARYLDLPQYIQLGKGEEQTGGKEKDSILASAFEALVGAIFRDKGLEASKDFIFSNFENELSRTSEFRDYKSLVQKEYGDRNISYDIARQTGPPHQSIFYVKLSINGKCLGKGEGRSKKEAEQKAAKQALKRLRRT